MPARAPRLPLTISRKDYLRDGTDREFRESLYVMVQSVGSLLRCREAFGRAMGLTANQYTVLMGVATRQGENGVSIKELAEHVALASTHVTTEVGRLERKGLLAKAVDEEDRRGVRVSLSRQGNAAIGKIAPLVRRINDILFEHISRDELAAAQKVARALVISGEKAIRELRRRGE